ncbi:YceI family protein [Cognatilysobacter bugurensis]|uniref:Polyisoprenoid-binding protein n=1 Tax=Cognatilysobacter bugurensis TaxID=543356 RepID=A0A918SXP4_9GAMM|nr:YceI family protein [Lysobacter bugurensis]GHA77623.1 polyisoprenoid-binding protein [Lysobacter bugurensis]
MRTRRRAAHLPTLPCLLLAAAAAAHARPPETWAIDPVHTRVQFAVDHAGFSKAIGTVSGSTGTLRFSPDSWADAHVDVEVPITRVDLGDARWNAATLAPRLLDAQRHPSARFVSRDVEPIDDTRARVCGELTLRGTSGPLCLDVVRNAVKRHPMPPFRRTAGFSATGTLSRAAFGVDAWPSMIGDAVELRIELEATRSRGRDDGTAEDSPEDTAR